MVIDTTHRLSCIIHGSVNFFSAEEKLTNYACSTLMYHWYKLLRRQDTSGVCLY